MQPGKSNWFAVVSKPRQEQTALENLALVRCIKGVLNMVRFGTELAVVPDSVIPAKAVASFKPSNN